MTARTHDLAAFTTLSLATTFQPVSEISLATLLTCLAANFIGGLTPDLDQPTADLWGRLPAGTVISRIVHPFLGGHRTISHSLLGVFMFGAASWYLFRSAQNVFLVDMNLVWWSFMLGYLSHLIVDMFTKEGVPWLFPLPFHFGIPPFKFLRMRTGGPIEKSIMFPSLLILNIYLYYANYTKFIEILHRIRL